MLHEAGFSNVSLFNAGLSISGWLVLRRLRPVALAATTSGTKCEFAATLQVDRKWGKRGRCADTANPSRLARLTRRQTASNVRWMALVQRVSKVEVELLQLGPSRLVTGVAA